MGLSLSAAGIAISAGLGTALCFGCGDFLAQGITRERGWLAAMFGVQLASALLLVVVASLWHGLPPLELPALGTLVGIAAVNTLGMVGLYRAFEIGQLSLVSPIAGSMGAWTLGFAWLAGHPPPAWSLPGLGLVLVGILAASVVVEPREHARATLTRAAGVGWALLSAVSFGWVFYVLGPSSRALGPAWSVLVLRLVAIAALIVLARPLGQRLELGLLRARAGRLWLVAALDSGGMVIFAFGSERAAASGQLTIVAVLASAFPIVVIALARLRLGERLRWWQWLGVATVLVGVLWVSATQE